MESLRQLVSADRDWIPTGDGESLYLRPFMIATEAFLGVRPAREVSFRVIASPAGNYFGGEPRSAVVTMQRPSPPSSKRKRTTASRFSSSTSSTTMPSKSSAG
jgi:branched-subunit amino acid aminotransferase/4-amino-4-deoxychorismate lyase